MMVSSINASSIIIKMSNKVRFKAIIPLKLKRLKWFNIRLATFKC
jgi:hypothetical protein